MKKAWGEVEDRSGGCCEIGTPACPDGPHWAQHLHHVLTRAQGGDDEAGNLLHVCARAHRWIHEHPAESYAKGWLMRGSEGRMAQRRRDVMAEALAAVWSGADLTDADAVLDQLADLGATLEVSS